MAELLVQFFLPDIDIDPDTHDDILDFTARHFQLGENAADLTSMDAHIVRPFQRQLARAVGSEGVGDGYTRQECELRCLGWDNGGTQEKGGINIPARW